ncbi:signal peptide peptidase SppA [Paramagnetospirillum marisnigri]|uniref:Signal peptide peptidase SppA n=2 Tax=Paramagnetospirillum marisnigri TaxID=1285242 RepID=A0A178M489_9PROT|nr:signal peptide peptidase SppA [Paramagnetospirillum marisnigri]
MRRLGRFLLVVLALVGVLSLSAVGLGVWLALQVSPRTEHDLPDKALLTLDLEARFKAQADGDPLAALSGEKSYELRQVLDALDRAAKDDRVVGLFASLGHAGLGLGEVQELRDAVTRFRASGKPATLFAETLGEGGGGTQDVYLASAFGEVWLQPSGEVGLTGLMAESPFLKGTFELLGVKPQFFGRHEFKSAIDMFTETGFSPAHRENLGRLLDSLHEQLVAGIASGRKLAPDVVAGLVGKGPFLPAEAKAAGLVDYIGYRDEALAPLLDGTAEELDLADYAAHLVEAKGTKVALIQGVGAIHRGESRHGFDSEPDFGARTIAEALREAAEDDSVKAILFRVDSPGGSYTASDTVWREVKRAREAGKPVVVSMGNMAASGGYFVAMAADRIVAQPGTVTGSIGVFTGKLVLEEFWKKIGVSWDEMHRGDNAAIWSANRPFTPEAKARIDALLDHIYADFTGKAAAGRGLSAEKMDQVARGRIWTGADARTLGLVDGLGGWFEAKAAVREVAGLKPDEGLRLVEYPRPRKVWELLAEAMAGGTVAERRHLAQLSRAVTALEPVLAPLAQLQGQAPLRLPPGATP